jgi:hypothetical protein
MRIRLKAAHVGIIRCGISHDDKALAGGELGNEINWAAFNPEFPLPSAQPLYRGYSDTEKSHFAANRDDCNGMGKREAFLGYGLK